MNKDSDNIVLEPSQEEKSQARTVVFQGGKDRRVVYLMSGAAHLPYLVCSLWTLRESGWGGTVEVYCWPESFSIGKEFIARDRRLGIEVKERHPKLRRKDGVGSNAQFLDKIDLAMELDCGTLLYLDADTTIHGKLDILFEIAEDRSFCATQWNDWTMDSGMVYDRIRKLLECSVPAEHVLKASKSKWPSVNGGVWAAQPISEVLPTWYEWTKRCGRLFIADERVLHLMLSMHMDKIAVACGGQYNCSPIYQPKGLRDEDVVVRHYHGDSCCRPEKSAKGFNLWWPVYRQCLEDNVGGMADWRNSVKNRHLDLVES